MSTSNNNGTNEKTGLLPTKHGTHDDHGQSFVQPKTTEQKVFVCFLIFMIVCLIGLGTVVIFDATTGKFSQRTIQQYDVTATSQLDLLNSLWHDKPTMESGCESTLLLLRHCEKNNDWPEHHGGDSYCSWLGRERSFFLSSLFDPKNPHRRWPRPDKIFALTEERDARYDQDDDNVDSHSNYREIETVQPLAHMFGLEIDVYGFDGEELSRDFFELLQSGSMCGKVTVVSWKHDLIPNLALKLACGPAEGCPYDYPYDSFDEVWQIKYVFDPKGKAKSAPETDPMNLHVQTEGPLVLYKQDTDPPMDPNKYVDDDDDDDDSVKLRRLKTKHHRKKSPAVRKSAEETTVESVERSMKKHKKKWVVYGMKTQQYFDPLEYSMTVGDYPTDGSGSPSGGKWADEI